MPEWSHRSTRALHLLRRHGRSRTPISGRNHVHNPKSSNARKCDRNLSHGRSWRRRCIRNRLRRRQWRALNRDPRLRPPVRSQALRRNAKSLRLRLCRGRTSSRCRVLNRRWNHARSRARTRVLIRVRCRKRSNRQRQLRLQWRVQRRDLMSRVSSRVPKAVRIHARMRVPIRVRCRRCNNSISPLRRLRSRVQKRSRTSNVRRPEWIPRGLSRAPSRGLRFDPSLVHSLRLRQHSRLRRGRTRVLRRPAGSPARKPPLLRNRMSMLLLDQSRSLRLHL